MKFGKVLNKVIASWSNDRTEWVGKAELINWKNLKYLALG